MEFLCLVSGIWHDQLHKNTTMLVVHHIEWHTVVQMFFHNHCNGINKEFLTCCLVLLQRFPELIPWHVDSTNMSRQ
jgi:hypothetical protein